MRDKAKDRKFSGMLRSLDINIWELQDKAGVSLSYLGLIDNGTSGLSVKLGAVIDEIAKQPKGTFHAKFYSEAK
jgi:hypothetical protein